MKAERRLEAKGTQRAPRLPGEDPDIAGIIPGPQPPREDMLLGLEPEPVEAEAEPEV